MRNPCPALLAAAVLSLAVFAARADILILTDDTLTAEAFPAAAESIRSHMLEGGAHAGLTVPQKDRVDTFLDRIQGYLDSGQPRDRPKIGQMQLRINSILTPQVAGTHNASEMICRREKPVGSRIVETVCHNRQALEDSSRQLQHDLIQKLEPGGEFN
jgi:hypothetical protein